MSSIPTIFVLVSLVICIAGLGLRINEIMRRPQKPDLSRPNGSVPRAILFAFTLGMAPWEKESTRLHWIAYLRGIFFHVGVFTAFGLLFASLLGWQLPLWISWPAAIIAGLGSLFGFAGIAMRLAGENERVLSLPDDYFSVVLTSWFAAIATLAVFFSSLQIVFYISSALLLLYIPISKIRHCLYFFYSKFFFGKSFGQRGVIGQSKSKYAE